MAKQQCHAGIELPTDGSPCPKCGAEEGDTCFEAFGYPPIPPAVRAELEALAHELEEGYDYAARVRVYRLLEQTP